MGNVVKFPTTVISFFRGPKAGFTTKMDALGYEFGSNTFCWKDGDKTKTRADLIDIDDLHVVPGTRDGPHQIVKFSGPRASRDAAVAELSWLEHTDDPAPQVANDTGLTIRNNPVPPTDSTNLITNTVMTGAVDETPGPQSYPDNWVASNDVPAITAVDTTSGAENIELQYDFSGSGESNVKFAPTVADIAAAVGDHFRFQIGLELLAGDFTNVTSFTISIRGYRSDGTTGVSFGSSFGEGLVSIVDNTLRTVEFLFKIPEDWATGSNAPPNDIKFVQFGVKITWDNDVDFKLKYQRPMVAKAVTSRYDRRPVFIGHGSRSARRIPATGPDINDPSLQLRGSNISTADFGGLVGLVNEAYTYPYAGTVNEYHTVVDMVNRGFNCFRFPFMAERLMRSRLGDFSEGDLDHVVGTVNEVTALGAYCLLDPHGFGGFGGSRLGRLDVGSTGGTETASEAGKPANTSTTMTLRSGSQFSINEGEPRYYFLGQKDTLGQTTTMNDWFNGYTVNLVGGTGAGQSRTITDTVRTEPTVIGEGGPKYTTITVSPAWDVIPDDTTAYTILGAGSSADDFADFWGRLADLFADNPRVIFGMMNEPTAAHSSEEYFPCQQAAINEIRSRGHKHMIFAVGTNWDGAHSWTEPISFSANDVFDDGYPAANDVFALATTDPINNTVWEVHQYFNEESSGVTPEVVDIPVLLARMDVFTNWARANGKRGFMGEFGTRASPEGRATMAAFLNYMETNCDVWIGYAGWSQGPWWSVSYDNYFDTTSTRGFEVFHPFQGV